MTSRLDLADEPSVEVKLVRCQRRLEQEQERVASLERFIEEKSRSLLLAQRSLKETHDFLSSVLGALPNTLLVLDFDGNIVDANEFSYALSGLTKQQILGSRVEDIIRLDQEDRKSALFGETAVEAEFVAHNGVAIPVLFNAAPVKRDGFNVGFVCIATDLRERQALELKLREANRLESVGQLAAGVAHELNTPIQFVSDSVQFLADAFEDIERVHLTIERVILDEIDEVRFAKALSQVEATRSEVDYDYLIDEIPEAVRRCRVGTERVSSIVRAMKRFTHPGSEWMVLEDVNEVLDSATIMAQSEYKYCAELVLELGPVPPVPLDAGQLNQAILNLIVNASHAIQDAMNADSERVLGSSECAGDEMLGKILITSAVEEHNVRISIEDDGIGIPDKVRQRIFEPFYTTKGVGRGTGQGLAQVWTAVVERHKGSIAVDSTPGIGTRFEILLPINPDETR